MDELKSPIKTPDSPNSKDSKWGSSSQQMAIGLPIRRSSTAFPAPDPEPPLASKCNRNIREPPISHKDLENNGENLSDCCKVTLYSIFSSLCLLMLTGALLIFSVAKTLESFKYATGIDTTIKDIPYIMKITSVSVFFIVAIGMAAMITGNLLTTHLFLVTLVILLISEAVNLFLLESHLEFKLRDLIYHWNDLSASSRGQIQLYGNCCGFNGPEDNPGETCPAGAIVGCKFRIHEIVLSVRDGMKISILGTIIVSIFLVSILYYLNKKRAK